MAGGDPTLKSVARRGDVMARGVNGWGPVPVASLLETSATTTPNAIAKYSNSTGKLANSGVLVDASNNVTGAVAQTNTGLLTLDLGTGALPAEVGASTLRVAQADTIPVRMEAFGFAATGLTLRGRAAEGTRASLAATADLRAFWFLSANGYTGSAWADSGAYTQRADGLWSGSNTGCFYRWTGVPNGSTVAATWMELKNAALSIPAGGLSIAGNFAQTGANTFSTGTGAISLNGTTTISSATAQLTISRTTGVNSSIVEFKDSTNAKYNWIAASQYSSDNAFEITPSTVAGGSTYSTPSILIAGATGRVSVGPIGSTFKGNIIAGVQDGTAFTAGAVGEKIESTINSTQNAAATGTYLALTSITLTPGDWFITGWVEAIPNGATLTVDGTTEMLIGTVSASNTGSTVAYDRGQSNHPIVAGVRHQIIVPCKRVNISSSTTYYANVLATFTLGTPQWIGSLSATRIR